MTIAQIECKGNAGMQNVLNKLQLSTIGIGLIMLLIGVGGLVAGSAYHALSQVQTIGKAWDGLGQRILPKNQHLYAMLGEMGYGGAIHEIKNMVLRLDPGLGSQANEDLERLQRHLSAYRKLGASEEEATDLGIIQGMLNAYRLSINKAQSMIANGDSSANIDNAIRYDDGSALEALARLNAAIVKEHKTAQSGMDLAVAAAKEFTKVTAILVIAALVIFALLMIYFIRWRIIRPLNSLADHVKHIGSGDLTNRIRLDTQDEVGTLARAVNEMTAGLQKLTTNARKASHQLSALASRTLLTTSEQASSVEEQFASIQQVAATVSEIVESGGQMAPKAHDVLLQAAAEGKKVEIEIVGLDAQDASTQLRDARLSAMPEKKAVGVVASTGGSNALASIFSKLPPDFPLPIPLVQHIGERFLRDFATWLSTISPLPACLGKAGDRPRPGTIQVAPGNVLMTVRAGRIQLEDTPLIDGHRPSGSALLGSMADCWGAGAIGVVLTGMGEDGARGLARMNEKDAFTIARDEKTSVIYGMPVAGAALSVASIILPLEAIPETLVQIVAASQACTGEVVKTEALNWRP